MLDLSARDRRECEPLLTAIMLFLALDERGVGDWLKYGFRTENLSKMRFAGLSAKFNRKTSSKRLRGIRSISSPGKSAESRKP